VVDERTTVLIEVKITCGIVFAAGRPDQIMRAATLELDRRRENV
jgi:hypothetical protein